MKYKHTVDTAVDPMPIDEMPIVRSFISRLEVTQYVLYSTIVMVRK